MFPTAKVDIEWWPEDKSSSGIDAVMETSEASTEKFPTTTISRAAARRLGKRRARKTSATPASLEHGHGPSDVALKPKASKIRTIQTRRRPNPMAARKLFVASLGNPAPYASSLHSASHTLLAALAPHVGLPAFVRCRALDNGLVSSSSRHASLDVTLWQCPTLMNVSGKSVKKAWEAWRRQLDDEEQRGAARLVVVHDELEVGLGVVKLRTGGSARGHNGVKSVVASMGGTEFTRIGIGIGRPNGRGPDEVAAYVLRKMSKRERDGIEGCVDSVLKMLGQLGAAQDGSQTKAT